MYANATWNGRRSCSVVIKHSWLDRVGAQVISKGACDWGLAVGIRLGTQAMIIVPGHLLHHGMAIDDFESACDELECMMPQVSEACEMSGHCHDIVRVLHLES